MKNVVATLVVFSAVAVQAAPAKVQSQWVQLGRNNTLLVRAVLASTGDQTCPSISTDSGDVAMSVRAAQTSDFATVCEASFSTVPASASINGTALPLPKANPANLVIVGDTGCRIKQTGNDEFKVQACNDPHEWPWASIAKQIAKSKPDLVIHVGDYLYRESACPAGQEKKCGGSPFGDNTATWNADWFTPAAPLLASTPFLFARGNHEDCKRAGDGWFRFLDVDPYDATTPCRDLSEPFAAQAGDLQLIDFDSSAAETLDASSYTAQFEAVNAMAKGNAWLVMHHPLWAVLDSKHKLVTVTPELQEASNNALAAPIKMVVTGHIHLFEALDFKDRRAPQFVIGNGGTMLDGAIDSGVKGTAVGGTTVRQFTTRDKFGWVTSTPSEGGWTYRILSRKGETKITCKIADARIRCDDAEETDD